MIVGCAVATACGSSGPKLPVATRVCRSDRAAVHALLPGATVRITNTDPADVQCLVSGGGVHVAVEAQASPQAWTQFDTVVVHAAQANQGDGPGGGSNPAQMPEDLALPYSAAWIAGLSELFATNGTESEGGSYVTVTVRALHQSQASRMRIAEVVATATFATAPRGPSPGPAPS